VHHCISFLQVDAARHRGRARHHQCCESCLKEVEARESTGFRRIDLLPLLQSKAPTDEGHPARHFQNKNKKKQRHIG
jgi:hypothetical protein